MHRRLLVLAPIAALLAACATASAPVSVADTADTADIVASYGLVHTVDRVLMPPR